jgi:hypothetical protein
VQYALKVRIAYAKGVHMLDGIADIVDARAAHPNALHHHPCPSMQIELAHVGRVFGIGKKGERAHAAPARCAHRQKARFVHAPGHLAIPELRQRAANPARLDAKSHPPAGAALAKAEHEAWPSVRAAIARRQDAKRPVIAVELGDRLLFVSKSRRPHERAIAEYPQIAFG